MAKKITTSSVELSNELTNAEKDRVLGCFSEEQDAMKTNIPPIKRITIKNDSTEQLFKMLVQAIEVAEKTKPMGTQGLHLIFTPRVDVANYLYYWIGIRIQGRELDFKLLVNRQMQDYILAYLKGDEILPQVTDFTPEQCATTPNEWLLSHEAEHKKIAIGYEERVDMAGEKNYIKTRMLFANGKVIYPATEVEDVLSLLTA